MMPDLINGLGSLFVLLNVRRIFKDKSVAGVSIAAVAFFQLWGVWNIYYYYHLSQFFSWTMGIALCLMNTIYLVGLVRYRNA